MAHYNCLIVDDEIELAKMTCEYFQMFDVATAYVDDGEDALKFLEENDVDMVLLDINLGEGSGFEVCRQIRETKQLPILFISARQSDDDVLVALSIGGDDYVKKPYNLSVLLAKVKVNLKRIENMEKEKLSEIESVKQSMMGAGGMGAGSMGMNGSLTGDAVNSADGVDANGNYVDGYNAGGNNTAGNDMEGSENEMIKLDAPTMSVISNGNKIPLKAKEFALLQCLYDHRNTIVTKEILFDEVWGDSFFSDGTLNVHIRKLREKLEDNPNEPKLIKTIWGTGYILEL